MFNDGNLIRHLWFKQAGDYAYRTTISKKNNVIIAVKNVANLIKPILMGIQNLYSQFYLKYHNVWIDKTKKMTQINSLLAVKNQLADIRNEFEYIDEKFKEVNNEPMSIVIGPLNIELGNSIRIIHLPPTIIFYMLIFYCCLAKKNWCGGPRLSLFIYVHIEL